MTDLAGRFRFDKVYPGSYALSVEAQGCTPAPAQPVKVAEEQTVKDLALRLDPLGVISGRVLDENGSPIPGASLKALRYAYSRNGKRLEARSFATADDHGEYRIFNLPPGRWYLGAAKRLP